MDEETKKIIEEQMKSLPRDVVEAIVSVDYKTKLQEIAKRQRLLIDQTGKLEMETTLVMIGLEPLADFIENLQRELVLSVIRAKEVAMDVSENIFKPIRESLRAMNGREEVVEKGEEEETEAPAPKFTNSNETSLNRDQILKEIEDPSLIDSSINKANKQTEKAENKIEIKKTAELEIRPNQELNTVPGETVRDITKEPTVNIWEAKMSGPTITPQEIVQAKAETKLPEIGDKKRPSSGIDPYREPLI